MSPLAQRRASPCCWTSSRRNLGRDVPRAGNAIRIAEYVVPSDIGGISVGSGDIRNAIDGTLFLIDDTPSAIDATFFLIDDVPSVIDAAFFLIDDVPSVIGATFFLIDDVSSVIDAALAATLLSSDAADAVRKAPICGRFFGRSSCRD